MGNAETAIIPIGKIEQTILQIRGHKVIIDRDLAALYGTTTRVLNQAISRHMDRFPTDFMFQLTEPEKVEVITNCDHLRSIKYSPVLPYAFTEHGAIMAASVLNTPRAVEISVFVVRSFVKLREVISNHKEILRKLDELEHKVSVHDDAIKNLFQTIHQLMQPPKPRKLQIGFKRETIKR